MNWRGVEYYVSVHDFLSSVLCKRARLFVCKWRIVYYVSVHDLMSAGDRDNKGEDDDDNSHSGLRRGGGFGGRGRGNVTMLLLLHLVSCDSVYNMYLYSYVLWCYANCFVIVVYVV